MVTETLKPILEALILAADEPLSVAQMRAILKEAEMEPLPETKLIRAALETLIEEYQDRGIGLQEVASGYRFQVHTDYMPYVKKLWREKPPKYSRAVLETLALITYRQPITRAEIESVRGVTVSTQVIRTLIEHEWVKIVGHKDTPGKPALYATTQQFLDALNLKNLEDLPELPELQQELETIE